MYKLPRKLTEILVLAQSLEHSTCALQAGRERGGRKTAAWTLNRKILVPVPVQRHKRRRFDPWVRKIPWSRKWQPVPVFLPGKFHGQRSLVGYSPWVTKSQTQLSKSAWAHACAHTHSPSSIVGLWVYDNSLSFISSWTQTRLKAFAGFFLRLMDISNELKANSTWKWKVLDQHNIASSLVSGRHTPFTSSPNGQGYHARNEMACSALHGLLTGNIPVSKIMLLPKSYCLTFL